MCLWVEGKKIYPGCTVSNKYYFPMLHRSSIFYVALSPTLLGSPCSTLQLRARSTVEETSARRGQDRGVPAVSPSVGLVGGWWGPIDDRCFRSQPPPSIVMAPADTEWGDVGSLTITSRCGQMAALANKQEETPFSSFLSPPVWACRTTIRDHPPDRHLTPADFHGHDLQGDQLDPPTQTSLETVAAGAIYRSLMLQYSSSLRH